MRQIIRKCIINPTIWILKNVVIPALIAGVVSVIGIALKAYLEWHGIL